MKPRDHVRRWLRGSARVWVPLGAGVIGGVRRRAPRGPWVVWLPALLALLALGGCAMPGTIAGSDQLPQAPAQSAAAPLPPIRFPQDEAPHRDLTEWWYYTGHLRGVDAQGQPHTYGFELTFFQTLRGSFPPYDAAHYAVTDVTRGQFHFDERAATGSASDLPLPGWQGGFDLTVGGWHMHGLDGHDSLNATMSDYTMALQLTGLKPPALHGGNGLITYGQAGFSYYYSRTRMAVAGVMNDHGDAIQVTGLAWMDHQWGNFVSLAGAGWDWYSIQLDNNAEYMLYVIRDSQKRPISTVGTYVAADGSTSEIPSTAIQTRATGSWTSPVTGGIYPSGWTVSVGGQSLSLTLTPELRDQELVTAHSTGIAYWEGAVSIAGTAQGRPVSGQGYVELTGYARIPPGSQSASAP